MEIPKHYSLHSENDSHFVVHDQRDGKTFHIAKKGLHPAHQIKVMKMQKLSGEDSEDNPQDQEVQPQQDSPAPEIPYYLQANPPEGSGPEPAVSPSSNAVEKPQEPPQKVGGKEVPVKSPDTVSQFEANQAMEEKGLKARGDIEAKLGEMNAQAHENTASKIQSFLDQSSAPIEKLAQENDALAHEIADPKSNIDPKAYFHNMGTGSKIANAIALVLGGLGAGLTRGPNMAMEVINGAIARDIESQKINLGKKESLLSRNLARYKDMKTAQMATFTQMNALAQGQIAANSARYGGQAAQAGTQAALGQLKNQNIQALTGLKQQVFENQLRQHLAQGDISKDDPLDYVKYVVPPDKQKDVAHELGQVQYASKHHEYLMNLYDKAMKEQTAIRRIGGLRGDSPSLLTLKNAMLPLIHDQEGRVSEIEQETVNRTLPGMFRADSSEKELRDGFEHFVMGKQNAPIAKTYGIDANKFNSTNMTHKGQDVERAFTSGPYKGKIGIFDANKNFKGFK